MGSFDDKEKENILYAINWFIRKYFIIVGFNDSAIFVGDIEVEGYI